MADRRTRRKYSSTASSAAASLRCRSAVRGVTASCSEAYAGGDGCGLLEARWVGEPGTEEAAVDVADRIEEDDSPREWVHAVACVPLEEVEVRLVPPGYRL